jgi:hypothetical protein
MREHIRGGLENGVEMVKKRCLRSGTTMHEPAAIFVEAHARALSSMIVLSQGPPRPLPCSRFNAFNFIHPRRTALLPV